MPRESGRMSRLRPLSFGPLALAILLLAAFWGWRTWLAFDRERTTQRLIANLSSDDPAVRLDALGELAKSDVDYAPALVKLLGHQDAQRRQFACAALGSLRPPADAALAPLTAALSDQDAKVRSCAVHAIGAYAASATQPLSPAETAAVRQLCRSLSDDSAMVREAAARVLGRFGAKSDLTAPALKSALADDNPSVRLRAAWSLYEIDDENLSLLVPVIRDVMAGDDIAAQGLAAGAVHALGDRAEEVMPSIVKDLHAQRPR